MNMTIKVKRMSCSRVGQTTFFSSSNVCWMKATGVVITKTQIVKRKFQNYNSKLKFLYFRFKMYI